MKRTCRNRDGYILPAVILFIIVSILMGMAVMELGIFDNIQAARREKRETAFYLAEAGINWVMAHANGEMSFGEEYEHYLGDGKFTVKTDWSYGEGFKIISTGTHLPGGIRETVQLINPDVSGYPGNGIFRSIYGNDWIDIEGSEDMIIGCDSTPAYVSSGGEIMTDLEESRHIKGYTSEYDPVELEPVPDEDDMEEKYGYDFETLEELPEEPLPSGQYRIEELNIGIRKNNLTEDGSDVVLSMDHLEMGGNEAIVIGEDATLTLYIDSNMSLTGNAKINEDGKPADVRIYSRANPTSTMKIEDDTDITGTVTVNAVIYAPEADVDISGDAFLKGGLVAGNIRMRGNPTICQDPALLSDDDLELPDWLPPHPTLLRRWTKPHWDLF